MQQSYILPESFVKNLFLYSFIFVVGISFFSCKDRNEYRVGSEFEPYVIRFENEAKLRGDTFHLRSRGLIVEFGDLEDKVAGLCHYGRPIRIEIDRNYWEEVGKFGGADLVREELLFHEMGHGLLGRKHLNYLLTNDEWKSIMCGGDKPDDRSWNVSYRGQRRKYYLDELFRESTPQAAIFTDKPRIDTSVYSLLLSDNFDNAASTLWKMENTAYATTSIENGMLNYQSKSAANMAILTEIPHVDIQSDFILEYTLQYTGAVDSAKYGLAFGTAASTGLNKESVDFFVINNAKKLYIGNTRWYSYFTEVRRNTIIPRGKNRMKILKIGAMLYCYINDEFAYASEIENIQPGCNFGFMVPGSQTVYLDDFRLYKRTAPASASNVRMNLTGKLNFTPIESIIHEAKQK